MGPTSASTLLPVPFGPTIAVRLPALGKGPSSSLERKDLKPAETSIAVLCHWLVSTAVQAWASLSICMQNLPALKRVHVVFAQHACATRVWRMIRIYLSARALSALLCAALGADRIGGRPVQRLRRDRVDPCMPYREAVVITPTWTPDGSVTPYPRNSLAQMVASDSFSAGHTRPTLAYLKLLFDPGRGKKKGITQRGSGLQPVYLHMSIGQQHR